MTETVLVDCAAAIPVGHRVEIRVLKEPEGGFLSRRTGSKVQVNQPWVKDLDTGVEYGLYWQYSATGALQGYAGQDFGPSMRGELETVKTVTGTVAGCRVLTIGSGDGWRLQTRLVVEVG